MDSEKAENTRESVSRPGHKWRRAIVATSVLGGMLFSGMAIVPTAVMKSSYRDNLLNSRLEEHGLTATSVSGSGSWLTPIVFHDISISDETGRVQCSIKTIRTSKSLISLIANGDNLGTFTIVEPTLTLALDDDGNLPLKLPEKSASTDKSDIAFVVENGAFKLSAPWRPLPIVDLDQLNISGTVATTEEGRWLTLAPIQIFDHEPLSDTHTEQNLALIAPVLAQSTALTGDVSVRLKETRVRLDADANGELRSLIRGDATFHTVDARLKKDWAVQVSQLVGHVAGQPVGDRLQIVRDSVVTFEVNDEGIFHRGLAFVLPDVASQMQIESSGLVGLDESLDLTFGLQFPQILPRGPLMAVFSKIVSAPLKLYVKGTVSEPKLEAPPGSSIVDQLSRNVAPDKHSEQPPPVSRAVFDLISSAASPEPGQSESITSGILNIIRAAKEAKANAPPKEPKPPKPRKRKRL